MKNTTNRPFDKAAWWLLAIVILMALIAVASVVDAAAPANGDPLNPDSDDPVRARVKRQSSNSNDPGGANSEAESEGEAEGSGEPETGKKEGGVSLGKILGIMFLICCIIYCIGIGWKVYKIWKGTYVEEEPVFLKYK